MDIVKYISKQKKAEIKWCGCLSSDIVAVVFMLCFARSLHTVHTFMKIVSSEREDLQVLFMILSPEGVDVLYQYLPWEELRNCCLF